tara:strand:- start:3312 stop:4670 length:1359 start_codon:yes stop_codon:yes gene_type:complete
MPTVLQFRRGTTTQNNAFTGALGEITYDTTADTLRVHDGSTAGGFAMVTAASTATLTNKTLTSPAIGTSIVPSSADGATIGSASAEFSDLFLADGSVIKFGNDQDITLTHVADTGLIFKNESTSGNSGVGAVLTLQTGDTDIASGNVLGHIKFQAPDEGTGTDAILVAAGISAASEGDFSSSNNATSLFFQTGASEAATNKMALRSDGDLRLLTDTAAIAFGADQDVTLTHVADTGLTLSVPATADNSFPKLNLSAGDNDIAADDVLGQIDFQAPAEGAGTDAIAVAATIKAVSEGDFSASNNATKLSFTTGKSAAAGTDGGLLEMSSTGKLTLKDLATADGASATITLQSGDTDIAADDELGGIFFQAPDEGTGTDAVLVAGGIVCMAEGDFSASSNATKISFRCGNSETATEKAKIVGSTGKFHATPDSILLIKNSSGSTLKTVNGHAAI